MKRSVNREFGILARTMILDGKALAESILAELVRHVSNYTAKGITPTLAVLLVGDNPASLAYIRQKQKAADRIGAKIVFEHLPFSTTAKQLGDRITTLNNDPDIHGLIVQRPVPLGNVEKLLHSVLREKDVDGFLSDSPFEVPVALAVGELLKLAHAKSDYEEKNYAAWLKKQNIVVIGRGETAGAPILRYFEKIHCTTSLIHSSTIRPEKIMKGADIIVSCAGRKQIVRAEVVKPGAIVISVGIWRDTSGKLRGDYDEEDIAPIASWYTPTPGGVGPVNVACLMQNLIKACMIKTGGTL